MSELKMQTGMPPEVIGLPLPWCIVAREEFEIAIENHVRSEFNLLEAVDVVKRALEAKRWGSWKHYIEVAEEVHWGLILREADRRCRWGTQAVHGCCQGPVRGLLSRTLPP